MLTNIAFIVPGEPQGKGRARVGRVGSHARLFTPPKTAAYENLVALAAQHAMGSGSPFSGPLAVEIEAVHTIPASWSKKRQQEAIGKPCQSKPDLDNIIKAIGDGANGIVWVDDKQIVQITAAKRYGARPEVRVRVATIWPSMV